MKSSKSSANSFVPLILLVLAVVAFGFVFNALRDTTANDWRTIVAYNCTESGGTFAGAACTCSLEGNQTQDEMYDETTGYCQTTFGGPGGIFSPDYKQLGPGEGG